jgi:hypothetical protein
MKNELLRFIDVDKLKPIEFAKLCYGLTCDIPFEEDLAEYLQTGFVVSSPTLIMLFRVCNIAKDGEPEEPAWYVRFACGDLCQLLNAFPCYLPKLVFRRAKIGRPIDSELHVCSFDRMKKLAFLRANKKDN